MKQNIFEESAKASLTGSKKFPEIVGSLINIGVESYHVDVMGLNVAKKMQHIYPFMMFPETAKKLGRNPNASLKVLLTEDPFDLFKKVVAEVELVQEIVKKVAGHFEPGATPTESLKKLAKQLKDLPYLEFSSYFNHLLHLTFAHFHEGLISSNKDLVCKKTCQTVLKNSNSFAEFLTALGAKK